LVYTAEPVLLLMLSLTKGLLAADKVVRSGECDPSLVKPVNDIAYNFPSTSCSQNPTSSRCMPRIWAERSADRPGSPCIHEANRLLHQYLSLSETQTRTYWLEAEAGVKPQARRGAP
jgi:hypothetical protein